MSRVVRLPLSSYPLTDDALDDLAVSLTYAGSRSRHADGERNAAPSDDPQSAIIRGTDGDDTLSGGAEGDTISGLFGNDVLRGNDGNDAISGDYFGGSLTGGNDILYGGAGNDDLSGERGNDILYGEAGDDELIGYIGSDQLYGGDDRDLLVDGNVDFNVTGEVNLLFGEGGDDHIRFTWRTGNRFEADGGEGTDRLDLDLFSVTSFDWSLVTDGDYRIGDSRVAGFELGRLTLGGATTVGFVINLGEVAFEVNGSLMGDTIIGGSGVNVFQGFGGDDTLRGEGGDDRLYGDSGADRLYGGAGADSIVPDASIFGGTSWGSDQIYGGAGFDSVTYSVVASGAEVTKHAGYYTVRHLSSGTIDTLRGVERVGFLDQQVQLDPFLFTDDDDDINFDQIDANAFASAYAANDHLKALTGNDIVRFPSTLSGYTTHKLTGATFLAGSGNDIVWGGQLADRLNGEGDSDTLNGEGGNDELRGGDGADVLDGSVGNDLLDGGEGVDTATFATSGAFVTVDLQAGTAVGSTSGSDTLVGIESAIGSAHADTLRGSSGVNRLEGGVGGDRVFGGAGADHLLGGAGDDLLVGATIEAADTDIDILEGGGEADRFLVDSNDIIRGFSANDVGAVYRGQNHARLVVIGEGSDREVRSYESGFGAYQSIQIQNAQAGQKLIAIADGNIDGATGAFLTFVGNPVGSVLSRVAFDPAQARSALTSRLDSFHDTVDTLFGGGSSAQAVVSDDPLHDSTTVAALAAVGIALAVKYLIVRRASALINVDFPQSPLGAPGSGLDEPLAATGAISDLFGVVQDFSLTADLVIRQSILPTFLRNDNRTVDAVSGMFDNGTGLEPATAGHLVLSAALDFQLTYLERAAVTTVREFLDAAGGGSTPSGATAAPGAGAAPTENGDILIARAAPATYAALGGDDLLVGDGIERAMGQTAASGVSHTFNGGAGTDTLTYGYDIVGVTVDLTAGTANGSFVGADTLISIENVSGGQGADVIRGGSGTNELYGAGGDDLLDGRTGADILDGGDGNDQLFGGAAADTLIGGAGSNLLDGGANTDTAIFSGAMADYKLYRDGSALRVKGLNSSDRLVDIEFLKFDDGTVDLTMIIDFPHLGQGLSIEELSQTEDSQVEAPRDVAAGGLGSEGLIARWAHDLAGHPLSQGAQNALTDHWLV